MLDFMGIAANIIKSDFTRQTIVIGMCPMPGSHNAENIKKAIETLVNEYTFNKSILSGKIFLISSSMLINNNLILFN